MLYLMCILIRSDCLIVCVSVLSTFWFRINCDDSSLNVIPYITLAFTLLNPGMF